MKAGHSKYSDDPVAVESYKGQIINELLSKVQLTMAQLNLVVISPFLGSIIGISMLNKWFNSHIGAMAFPMVKLLIPHAKSFKTVPTSDQSSKSNTILHLGEKDSGYSATFKDFKDARMMIPIVSL